MSSALVFAFCLAALVAATWSVRRSDPDATVAELFDLALQDRTVRLAVLVCWWWLGWHFLAGQTVDP